MKTLRWLLTLCPLLLAPALSQADDIATIAFGPSLNGTTNPKEFALGYEKTWGELALYSHCGAIFEARLNGYCSVGIGVHVETPSGLFTRATVGPAYVIHTNDRITTNGNANLVFAVGAYQASAFIDLEYGHLSNAGTGGANLGDDHALAQIGYRL